MTLVLTPDLANTSIGEILAKSTDPIVELHDESGNLVARILINQDSPSPEYQQLLESAENDLGDIQGRLIARDAAVTTEAMLRQAREAAGE